MLSSRRSRLVLLSLVAALAAVAAVAPGVAAAAQRYASPGGTGDCSSASPCKLTQAVGGASAGDEVIANPGKYLLTTTVFIPATVTVHGVAGQPRPRLMFSGASQAGVSVQAGSALRYVEIEQAAASPALIASASTVDQVIARGVGPSYYTAAINDSTIRNSIVTASAPYARALMTTSDYGTVSGTYRNVTAIASGAGGLPIEAYGESAGRAKIQLVNVIAYAGPGAVSLLARTDSSNGAEATIGYTHTAYQSVNKVGIGAELVTGLGNRAEEPAFVSPVSGDFRLAAGSFMIDAGADDPLNGAFDFAGDLRTIGKTDIGADEFVPAAVATTGAPTDVGERSATLNGTVEPNGAATTYTFQYGTTAAYGSETAAKQVGRDVSLEAATATIGELTPGTTYHYRLVATNSGGSRQGGDRTFTTPLPATPAATPAAPAEPPASPLAQPFAGVRLLSTRLTLADRFITVGLSCPAGTAGGCAGVTKLTAVRPRTSSRPAARVTVGRASFSIAAGQRARVRVRVSRAGRRLFARTRRLSGRAENAARSGAGQSRTTVAAVTIRKRR